MTDRFAYDEVPYDTEANPEAHPRAMGTLARLFGLRSAPACSARILEIGCGDGDHLIAAASYMPDARFVGFDLAADAIARGALVAKAIGGVNERAIELLHRDVCDVRARGLGLEDDAPFDYVVAHGIYSWVPEVVRADVLAVMRNALAPSGVGFLSVNALPGWELRRALRILMREATMTIEDPAEKVRTALDLVDGLASASGDGFVGVLARAATEYRSHVVQATPPSAPFSRYVFHDLLAECNDPFSVEQLDERLRAAGLKLVCETPLGNTKRGFDVGALAEEMATSGRPFLQVLVCRDDAPNTPPLGETVAPDLTAIRTMHLWADLTPKVEGGYRTTAGALVRGLSGAWLERAAQAAPGFVAVRDLAADDAAMEQLERDLFEAARGLFTIATDAPAIRGLSATPRVATHVLLRARAAAEHGASTAVLTSALHQSFWVPWAELIVIRELDGKTDRATIGERVSQAVRAARAPDLIRGTVAAHVDTVLDRFARYGFLIDPEVSAR